MRTTRLKATGLPWFGLALVALFTPQLPAANINYNFNPKDEGWTSETAGSIPSWFWTKGPSSLDGGWQAFSGSNAADTGTYLTSPCLEVSQNPGEQFVKFDISHRFNFPLSSGTSGTADYLGQVQFKILSGTNADGWRGIPTQFFTGTATHLVPSYPGPSDPPLFGSLLITSATVTSGTFPVQAWAQTTTAFASGFYEKSQFELDWSEFGLSQGTEFQVRFLMAANAASTSGTAINWEINSIDINGAKECIVPEPGTLALAATGLVAGLGWYVRRRVRRPMVALLVALAVLGLAHEARAEAIFDFRTGSKNWTVGGNMTGVYKWNYVGPSATPAHWTVQPGAVGFGFTGNSTLSSSTISTLTSGTAAIAVRVSIAHAFDIFGNVSGGQLLYRLNNSGPWIASTISQFTSGSSINYLNTTFGPSPFSTLLPPPPPTVSPIVSGSTFVAPTKQPSNAALGNTGASFVGISPGFIPSEWIITSATNNISSIELQFNMGNVGTTCPPGYWDLRYVQVDYATTEGAVPEPGTLMLAITGAIISWSTWRMRGRMAGRATAASSIPGLEAQRDPLHDHAAAGVGGA